MSTPVFRTAAISLPGGLPVNQDAWAHEETGDGRHCWALADGLGGHAGGEIAARLAVDAAVDAFGGNSPVDETTLQRIGTAATQAVHQRQREDRSVAGMRTTLVALVSDGRAAAWTHIGDSRLYLLRRGRIVRQTRDHSVPRAMADGGEIPYSAIRTHEDRGSLLRSLGGSEAARFEPVPHPEMLRPGDAFLLCSDGFWDYVLDREMEADLLKSRSPDEWLERMFLDRVLRRAPPVSDNMTAVAVFEASS